MKLAFILFLLFAAVVITLTNEQIRVYIFAQQQQGLLQFASPSEPSSEQDTPIFVASSSDITQQVDWVFENTGRCWNAWSSLSCGLQQHEGGVTVPSMRDLNHDGVEDISCSQGGTSMGTTITNISDKTITINCERYTCNACATGNGTYAQCDGGTDPKANRVVDTVELTPGCVATCTMQGVFGSCLPEKEPPQEPQITPNTTSTPQPVNTSVPTPTNQLSPTILPSNNPDSSLQPTNEPTATHIPPTNIPVETQIPNPTVASKGSHLPVAIDYSSYAQSYNEYPPTYVYAMMNRSYDQQSTARGITGLAQVNGNVVKMIMISEYNALEQILQNHAEDIKAAGITWIGYNAERDGRTPESELTNIFSSNPSTNIINKMGKLTHQYGLKLMLGPTTPMWEEYFRRYDTDAVANAMMGDNCSLDGIAFQEQKQISLTNKQERANTVAQRTAFFRNHAQKCPQFESMVQIMSSWCSQNSSWEECRGYYHLLKDLEGPSRINALAIWASGSERNDLPSFIDFLRK